MRIKPPSSSVILMVLVALSVATKAQAYVDPNSAGLLYQIFFPVVVAIGLMWRWVKEAIKQAWLKIVRKEN
jgi:hypothetical protein